MKNKMLFTSSIIIFSIWIIFFTTALVLGFVVDVDKEMNLLAEYSSQNSIVDATFTNDYLNNVSGNIQNAFQLSYFTFGYEGFSLMRHIHSFKFVMFNFSWNFMTPIFGILTVLMAGIWMCKFIAESIKRQYKYTIMKDVGKYSMYASMLGFFLVMIIGLSLLSNLEKEFTSSDLTIFWGGNSSTLYHKAYPDAFSFFTALQFSSPNGLSSLLGGNLGYSQDLNISLPNGQITTTLVFLIILTPILGITLIASTSIYLGTFLSAGNNESSKFNNWIQNVRIDSMREYRSAILRNQWLWILMVIYSSTIIIPGLIHPYETTQQIALASIAVVVIPFGLTPLIVGVVKVKLMQAFSYNLLIWIQILLLWIIGTSIQLVTWILMKEDVGTNAAFASFWPFIMISTSTIAAFGFIKFKK